MYLYKNLDLGRQFILLFNCLGVETYESECTYRHCLSQRDIDADISPNSLARIGLLQGERGQEVIALVQVVGVLFQEFVDDAYELAQADFGWRAGCTVTDQGADHAVHGTQAPDEIIGFLDVG